VASQLGRDAVQVVGVVAEAMRHLADGTRLRLLLTLAAGGEQNVAELCQALSAPQPAVSHHLGILRRARLVRARRQGREIYYSLADRASADGTHALRVSAGGATLVIDVPRRAGGNGRGFSNRGSTR
jgi:DNA-binding transcriptional ArsR family regulator